MKKSEFKQLIREEISKALHEEGNIYYVVFNMTTNKYEVATSSKYANQSITGSLRFKTPQEAKTAADKLNS